MQNGHSQPSSKKIGLALGGGAARGFCHIGVLKVLEEYKIPIDCIAGCSMGAVIGGAYATGVSIGQMEAFAERMSDFMVRDLSISGKNQGFFKGGRVMKMLRSLFGEKTFADCSIPFSATATDIKKGELHVFTEGELATVIRASVSIPGVFHVAQVDGIRYVDGNIIESVPCRAARALGADIVIAVDAIGAVRPDYEPKGIFDMLERMILIMNWMSNKQRIQTEPDFLITPDQGNRSMQKFKNNSLSIAAGEKAARAAIPEILKLIQ